MPAIIIFSLLILIVLFLLIYIKWLRPWQLSWGATPDEIKRPMRGDEIVPAPSFNATRAVTVQAPPDAIYPWIVQIGLNRAGWYSYDILDNLGRHSAETILPQFQQIQPGDLIPMSPDGKYGIWVKEFEAPNWILWWDQKGDTSWLWQIEPTGEHGCRLITRVRTQFHWFSPALVFNLLIEFCDIIMMRRCMLNIKQRAERMARRQ